MTPGLTCAQCKQRLYPAVVRATENGWTHVDRCPKACAVTDCTRVLHAYGYCSSHAHRFRKYGDPLHGEIRVVDTEARLEDLRWMAETGESLTGASIRMGEKVKTVEAFLRRNDPACLALLIAQEPKDHNRRPDRVSISELTGLTERRKRLQKVAA